MTQKTVYIPHLRMRLRMHKVNFIVDSTQQTITMSFIEIHTTISIHHKLNFNNLFSLFGVNIHILYNIISIVMTLKHVYYSRIVMTLKHIYYSLFILIMK